LSKIVPRLREFGYHEVLATRGPHPAAQPLPGDVPGPGAIIGGKYQVTRVLGRGGMGVVVAAHHTILKHTVAVKFLLPQATELPGATERFLREAQSAVAIRSEHVARVIDVGRSSEGAPFIVDFACPGGAEPPSASLRA